MATPRTKPSTGLLSRGSRPTSLIDSWLKSLVSKHTRRSYERSIGDLYAFAAGRPISGGLLHDWRNEMAKHSSIATVNTRIMAARSLVNYALQAGTIQAPEAMELLQVGGLPNRGERVGNWLTEKQTAQYLGVPYRANARGKRNYCILAILAGCALRVDEVSNLNIEIIVQREGRWVIADLPGKGGRRRTVAIPGFTKRAIDDWTKEAKIKTGKLIRPLTMVDRGLSTDAIRDIVRKAAQKIGVANFGPHDLRRTCAKLCRDRGGELEQIQVMLGHESLETTQRYLGTQQNLKTAVNDLLVF